MNPNMKIDDYSLQMPEDVQQGIRDRDASWDLFKEKIENGFAPNKDTIAGLLSSQEALRNVPEAYRREKYATYARLASTAFMGVNPENFEYYRNAMTAYGPSSPLDQYRIIFWSREAAFMSQRPGERLKGACHALAGMAVSLVSESPRFVLHPDVDKSSIKDRLLTRVKHVGANVIAFAANVTGSKSLARKVML